MPSTETIPITKMSLIYSLIDLIFALLLILLSNVSSERDLEQRQLIKHLLASDRYDHRIQPGNDEYRIILLQHQVKYKNGEQIEEHRDEEVLRNVSRYQLPVSVDFFVRNIEDISIKQHLNIELTFRQQWKDPRLAFSHPRFQYITLNAMENIWKPDLFISNEMDGHFHDILESNSLIRLYSNGTVLHSIRISLKLSCPMNFKLFPFDTQTCPIYVASYGHTTKDMILTWNINKPIQMKKKLIETPIKHQNLVSTSTDLCTSRTTTGEYPCIKVELAFERKSIFYIGKYFIPSGILVLVCWSTFLIPARKSLTRIIILTLICFMLYATVRELKKNSPEVDYCTIADVWTVNCFWQIIGAFLQLALGQYLYERRKNKPKISILINGKNDENGVNQLDDNQSRHSTIRKLDLVSLIVFPVTFVLLNVILITAHYNSS